MRPRADLVHPALLALISGLSLSLMGAMLLRRPGPASASSAPVEADEPAIAREPDPGRSPPANAAASSSASAPGPAAAGSQPSGQAAGSPRVDSVLLLTVDALRADQPWLGYAKFETPALSRFAREGLLFSRAYSVANTTTPSLSALLAARYPSEMPRDDCPLAGFDLGEGLAPFLRSKGVHTFAAHGHAIFASSFAPRAGFDDWRLVRDASGRRAADGAITGGEVGAMVEDFLRAPPPRFFAWAHLVEPHDTYVPHPGFPGSNDPVRGLYDGEVQYVDSIIGHVLEVLDQSPAAGRTAVIVAADHGEAFGEHGLSRHGFTVHDEEVRVPLMIKAPGLSPGRVDTPRSTIDVARTVADLMGLEPPARWRGASLLRDAGSASPEPRPVLVDAPQLMNLPQQRAFIDGDTKVIIHPTRGGVFDLASDPKERSPGHDREAEARAQAAFSALDQVPAKPCSREAFKR